MTNSTSRKTRLNRWGRMAQQAWRTMAPTAYSLIPNPTAHFSQVGREAERRIEETAIQLEAPDRGTDQGLEKAGRIQQARMAAEEIVIKELIEPPEFLREEPDEDQDMDPERLADLREMLEIANAGRMEYYLLPWITEMPDQQEDPELYQEVVDLKAWKADEEAARKAELIRLAKEYLGLE